MDWDLNDSDSTAATDQRLTPLGDRLTGKRHLESAKEGCGV